MVTRRDVFDVGCKRDMGAEEWPMKCVRIEMRAIERSLRFGKVEVGGAPSSSPDKISGGFSVFKDLAYIA